VTEHAIHAAHKLAYLQMSVKLRRLMLITNAPHNWIPLAVTLLVVG